jgi:predicted dehydrogenase
VSARVDSYPRPGPQEGTVIAAAGSESYPLLRRAAVRSGEIQGGGAHLSRLGVGLIGVGRIADLHYEGYKDNPKVELRAVADVNEGVLERRRSAWGVAQATTDYRKLLQNPAVDAVEVITPHHLHKEIGVAALQAGKHVSMQKPMAMNIAECDALIAAAERSGKMFRVFENFRYYPPLVKAWELVQTGEIGEPLSIRMKVVQGSMSQGWEIPDETVSWRFDPARSGGGRVIFDYGYHLFSVAMWFLGEVEKVHAYITYRKTKYGLLDSPAVVTWKYKDADRYGSYEAISSGDLIVPSKYWPEDEWFEISGRRGFIWVNRCTSMLLDRPPVVLYRDGVTTSFSNIDSDWAASFRNGVWDFIDSVIAGRQPPLTGMEGRRVHQFCRAIQRSARENREIQLDEITKE